MTSLYSSIVHLLSGLNHNALTHATDRSQLKVGTENAYLEFSFNPPISFPLVDSHCSKTPWSVFQDGSVKVVLTRSILSHAFHFLYSWNQNSSCLSRSQVLLWLQRLRRKTTDTTQEAFCLGITQLLTLPFQRFQVF